MKTIEQYFADWEGQVFGYGYGTGEDPVLRALKSFLDATPNKGSYDYERLEGVVTSPVTWLMINILAHADMIEYGTSPRYGWLTDSGRALAEFVASRSVDDLVSAVLDDNNRCYRNHCNCEGGDCRPSNPFWSKR